MEDRLDCGRGVKGLAAWQALFAGNDREYRIMRFAKRLSAVMVGWKEVNDGLKYCSTNADLESNPASVIQMPN